MRRSRRTVAECGAAVNSLDGDFAALAAIVHGVDGNEIDALLCPGGILLPVSRLPLRSSVQHFEAVVFQRHQIAGNL